MPVQIVESKLFGRLECEPGQILHIPGGLPGLPGTRDLLPISQRVVEPFVFFQSIQEVQVCILSLPVLVVRKDFELVLSAEDRELLGLDGKESLVLGEKVGAFAFVSVDEQKVPTANLLAPLVIHFGAGLAAQAIQPVDESNLRFPLPVQVAGGLEC